MLDTANQTQTGMMRVLVFGDTSMIPSDSGIEITTDPAAAVGLVVVLPNGGDPFPVLAEHDRLLTPLLDLEARLPRADVRDVLQPTAIPRAIQATRGLRETVESLPEGLGGGGDPRLVPLAYAWTRRRDISPLYCPDIPAMLSYPALAGLTMDAHDLEGLANAGLLATGDFFDRTHVCDECASARLITQEICPSCQSAKLTVEDLLHHYRCAWQAPRSEFRHTARSETPGRDLACPKCRREPRHYGVDYDAAGTVSTCDSCGKWSTEPEVRFRCGDCGHAMRGADAPQRDWYAFSLTEAAREAVLRGRMPDVQLSSLLADAAGGCTPRDIAFLADWSQRVRARYGNEFSMLQISVDGIGHGRLRDDVLKLVADTVKEMTRTSDAICSLGDDAIAFLAEIGPEGAEIVRGRIEERLQSQTRADAELTVTLYDADNAEVLIERLTDRRR